MGLKRSVIWRERSACASEISRPLFHHATKFVLGRADRDAGWRSRVWPLVYGPLKALGIRFRGLCQRTCLRPFSRLDRDVNLGWAGDGEQQSRFLIL